MPLPPGVLFRSEGRSERQINRRVGAAAAVFQLLYRYVVAKRELKQKAKISIYRSIFIPLTTYGHGLWFMNERTRRQIQAPERILLWRVALVIGGEP